MALWCTFALAVLCGQVVAQSSKDQAGSISFRGAADAIDFRGAPTRDVLLDELSDKDHHLATLEKDLGKLFAVLPKNSFQKLGPQSVRLALQRYFVDRHGWYFYGLDSGLALQKGDTNKTVPDYLEEAYAASTGAQGADLRGLAALAASLTDLVDKDVQAHLQLAYEAHNFPSEGKLSKDAVLKVLETYLIIFLWENNLTGKSVSDMEFVEHSFTKRYPNYTGIHQWYEDIMKRHVADEKEGWTLQEVAETGKGIVRKYHEMNDMDCEDLRVVMKGLEGRKPGRVRLSTFYKSGRHSHWKFTDKVEKMRAMGVLDESDPEVPMVIIPNYVLSLSQCLKSFSLYAICCKDVCEDLQVQIETELGTSQAPPERIVQVLEGMSSAMWKLNGTISASLRSRLSEMSSLHGGQVPIHGRLFAQWLHHLHPLHCPHPHEGTINHAAINALSSEDASEEEMQHHVDSDTCPIDANGMVGCAGESTELPWSTAEHFAEVNIPKPTVPGGTPRLLRVLCVLLLVAARATVVVPGVTAKQHRVQTIASAVAGGAYLVDLLDTRIFFLVQAVGLSWIFAQKLPSRAVTKYAKFDDSCCKDFV